MDDARDFTERSAPPDEHRAAVGAGSHLIPCLPPPIPPLVHRALPEIAILNDAIFVPKAAGAPFEESRGWGVYRSDGRLCEAAAYRRGGVGRVGHRDFTDVRPEQSLPSDATFVYAGPCHQHYGHMIVSTLARFWPDFRFGRKTKFLFHGDATPAHWFAYPHFREIMGALGFDSSDFVNLRHAFRVPNLVVPGPAFQELLDCHQVFGELGARIGDALSPPPLTGADAIYLSKSRLPRGVWRIANETDIEDELRRLGVEIVYPETLTVAEQVAKIEGARVVMGTMGSAIHTTLFTRHPTKVRGLCISRHVVGNYALIDTLKGADALYLQADSVDILPPTGMFELNVRVNAPVEVAREYAALCLD